AVSDASLWSTWITSVAHFGLDQWASADRRMAYLADHATPLGPRARRGSRRGATAVIADRARAVSRHPARPASRWRSAAREPPPGRESSRASQYRAGSARRVDRRRLDRDGARSGHIRDPRDTR